MKNIPDKCLKCGAPIELDPYKDFVKCNYCGSINIFENGRLISKSDGYLKKFGEYLPKLKQKKVFIPLIIFSILVPVGIYKMNYIDDFLVKECQIRTRESNDGDFISKKNYKKCLRKIKREWANLASSTCIDMKKYSTYIDRLGPTSAEKELKSLEKKSESCQNIRSISMWGEQNCISIYGEDKCKNRKQKWIDKKAECNEIWNKEQNSIYQVRSDKWELKEWKEERFKKETLRVGMDWLKNNEILKNGFFSKAKCIKNLKKVAHLIFGRSKSSFE